jgi:hypothetical protein
MKKISIIIGLAVMASVAFSCKSKTSTTTTESTTLQQKVVYTCSMHPEVQSDKPGKCPKCGMDLVVKE